MDKTLPSKDHSALLFSKSFEKKKKGMSTCHLLSDGQSARLGHGFQLPSFLHACSRVRACSLPACACVTPWHGCEVRLFKLGMLIFQASGKWLEAL